MYSTVVVGCSNNIILQASQRRLKLIPSQSNPSPLKPVKQLHVKPPTEFAQVAFGLQLMLIFSEHLSISASTTNTGFFISISRKLVGTTAIFNLESNQYLSVANAEVLWLSLRRRMH